MPKYCCPLLENSGMITLNVTAHDKIWGGQIICDSWDGREVEEYIYYCPFCGHHLNEEVKPHDKYPEGTPEHLKRGFEPK